MGEKIGKKDVKVTIKREKQPMVNKLNYVKTNPVNLNSQNRRSSNPVNKLPKELVRKALQGKYNNTKQSSNKCQSNNEPTNKNISSKGNDSTSYSNIKVACILDAIPMEWFKYECTLLPLDSKNWFNQIAKEKPNMLLVQSTWRDYKGDWNYNMINLNNASNNNLIKLLRFCKKKQVPTVFWNIEDPYDFNTFIGVAKHFDYVFTTDSGSIQNYNSILRHRRVYALPFAAQPRIHNPINKDVMKESNLAFAGSWYHIGHHDRKRDMEIILKPALKYNVDIYDRMYSLTKNKAFKFPNIYQKYIKGYLPYPQMSSAYKKYHVFLNVNTVQNSPTMFSCRIFELLASGVNVVSGYSLGIQKMFPNIVKMSRSEAQTDKHLSELLKDKDMQDKLSVLGQREVFSKHTYRQRMEAIFDKVGIKYNKIQQPGVTIITTSNHDNKIDNVFKNYTSQKYSKKELIIILNNNDMNIDVWKNETKKYSNVRVFKLDESNTLGTCLNYAIERAKYDYIAKFDDNGYYCPNYLVDIMHSFEYSNADIIGKQSYYAYIENSKTLVTCIPIKENRFVNEVASSTIVCKKKVLKTVKFPTNIKFGTGSEFLRACVKKGFKIYSVDRFNHVLHTNSSTDGLTIIVNDKLSLKNYTKVSITDNYTKLVTV